MTPREAFYARTRMISIGGAGALHFNLIYHPLFAGRWHEVWSDRLDGGPS
jgi:hypothetical protein